MKQHLHFKLLFMMIVILSVLSMTALLAQEGEGEDAETTPEPVDCDSLASIQIELATLLDDFEALLADDEETALATLYEVGVSYQELAFECGYIPPNAGDLVIGTDDLERIFSVLETLDGDPLNGQLLYNGGDNGAGGVTLGCSGCHEAGIVAPFTSGTWTRWDEMRSLEEQFAEYTFEQYIIESIIHPDAYLADDFPVGMMPSIYPDQLGFQDLADLVAYLESQDQLP